MIMTKAVVHLRSSAPYSQSQKHNEPKLEGESPDAYERRTWENKMHVRTFNKGKPSERRSVVIPASAMSQAIAAAAKFLNKKIPGQKNATWTKHFVAGVAILADIDLNIDPATRRCQEINAHSNGVRGSGSRVTKLIPTFDEWEASFEVIVFDPIITEGIFTEVIEAAGLFVGIGQHRPECLGTNGRWEVDSIEWIDARQSQPLKKAA